MNKRLVSSISKVVFASILTLVVSTQAIALPMKGSLGITGAIKSIDYVSEEVFFTSPGWAEVSAAEEGFLNDFEVKEPGPWGSSGSWVNYYGFGASSVSGDMLWSFDKGYDGTIDLWFELSYLYAQEFDAIAGTVEVLGRGFLTDGSERVESHWSFNSTQKGDSIVFSSAFAVPEPASLLLFIIGLLALVTFRNVTPQRTL
ncbi:MAG: PEP-CTERM sorting domain-containing protein [Pseudomonadales bacterium]|nr:PEP-CTERM sorting domain-containing protein [Pseudomonadales bacterium]